MTVIGPDPIETTRKLLVDGWRPFPLSHSLPYFIPISRTPYKTVGPYNGEPRVEQPFLAVPEMQIWARRWVDIIVELWAGPIHLQGEKRELQRNDVLMTIQMLWTSSMKQRLYDAYTEDLRAVRELLVRDRIIKGPPPMLLIEVEGKRGSPIL